MTEDEFYTVIRRLAKGDREALRAIYDAYSRMIYAIVYDVLKNREDAEDVTSEFFIRLFRAAGTYRRHTSHRAWLIRIARNMAIDLLRKQGHASLLYEDETHGSQEEQLDVAAQEKKNDSAVERQVILAEDLQQAMQELSVSEKEVIDLKLIFDLKFKEIAAAVEKPIGTVTWLYNQGIRKLRRCLSDYE